MRYSKPKAAFVAIVFLVAAGPLYAQEGGPDAFGYHYSASPTLFSWIDISVTGQNLGLDAQDSAGQFPIGFDFDFYGYTYSQLNVGANGIVYFTTDTTIGEDNVCIPGQHSYGSGDYPMIAGFWDDLSPTSASGVYYQLTGVSPGRQATIMWNQVPRTGTSGGLSFEVVLRESDNSVLIQHLDTNVGNPSYDHGQSATVGIEDWGQNNSYGLQYSCNTPSVIDGTGIVFSAAPHPEGWVFEDGFESGNTNGWSNAVGTSG